MSGRHVPFRWLVDVADGVLTGPRYDRVEAHMSQGCPRCERDLAWVVETLGAMREGPLEAPPASAVRLAIAAAAGTRPAAGPGGVTLLADRRGELVAGMRDCGVSTRRLLWTLPGYELDLAVDCGPRTCDLFGQVVPEGDDPSRTVTGRVRAVSGKSVREASVTSDGRFDLRGIPPGAVRLEGTVDGVPFVLPEVVLD